MRLKEQERSIALIRRRQRGFGLGLTLVLAFACSAETDRGPEVQAKRQAAAADEVLINEVYVNAPGGGDDGVEYIELRGTPGASLADVHLLIIDGDANAAGEVDDSIDFSTACGGAACSLGANGLLLLAAPGAYTPPAETTLVAILPTGDSVLENNSHLTAAGEERRADRRGYGSGRERRRRPRSAVGHHGARQRRLDRR